MGDLPGPDPFLKLHGLSGPSFVEGYLSCLDERVSNIVLPFSSLFHAPDSELNPFCAFMEASGFLHHGLWMPDLLEAESRSAFQAAAEAQTGFHLARDGIPRLVPHGLQALEHISSARTITTLPFDSPAPHFVGDPVRDSHLGSRR